VKRARFVALAGSLAEHNTRRVLLKKFPFSVIYRPEPDGIVIFAVAHQSRRPGYWRGRPPAR
jgi:toxin ParE1/3/4